MKLLDHPRALLPKDRPLRLTYVFALRSHESQMRGGKLAFSPDSKTLAIAGSIGRRKERIAVWDVEKRKLLRLLAQGDQESPYTYMAIAFLPPGNRLVTGCWALNDDAPPCPWCRKVFLWDLGTGKVLDTFEVGDGARDHVTGLAVVGDGSRVICCASTGMFEWDTKATVHRSLPLAEYVPLSEAGRQRDVPPVRRCYQVAATADGSHFVSTVEDPSFFEPRILVWDAATRRVTRVIEAPLLSPNPFAYALDGSCVAAVCRGYPHDAICVWDAATGEKILGTGGAMDYRLGVPKLALSPDGRYLFALCQIDPPGGKFYTVIWDVKTGKLANRLEGHNWMEISPDGKYMAGFGRDVDFYAIERE